MQAKFIQVGRELDYTPGADVAAGKVIVQSKLVGIAKTAIASGVQGSIAVSGIFDVVQKAEIIAVGSAVYWDATGDPVGGEADGEGAVTATAVGNTFMGFAQAASVAEDSTVRVALRSAETVAGGVATATSITATGATFPIAGLEAAQGGSVSVTGGESTEAANAGGATAIVGGEGNTSGAGGAVSLTGGTPGVTGVGGAATVAGGPGGTTSGNGGAVAITGGAAQNDNDDGGAVAINGGLKNGSGDDGAVTIGTGNTSSVTVGKAGVLTAFAGPAQMRLNEARDATTGGGTSGLITAGSNFVTVTSDNVDKQISLPAASVGDEIEILVTGANCELISAVAEHKVNTVTVGATNELALVENSLYRCKYVAANNWIVTGLTDEGVVETPLAPDAR